LGFAPEEDLRAAGCDPILSSAIDWLVDLDDRPADRLLIGYRAATDFGRPSEDSNNPKPPEHEPTEKYGLVEAVIECGPARLEFRCDGYGRMRARRTRSEREIVEVDRVFESADAISFLDEELQRILD
jgi:hypothetical protein